MLLKSLTEANGVSGNEKEVRQLIIDEIKGYVSSLKVDKIGNIIIHKEGKKNKQTLMVTAHMDEVGLIVKDIDSHGLMKFMTVGGIDKRILVSKKVLVGQNRVPGVIGAKPIHLQNKKEWKKALDIDSLYIDIGAKSKEDALKYINIGDYVAFDTDFSEFGDNLIKAKALDNRVGCSLLIDLIKTIDDVDFYGVFTVMEEIGLRGAAPAAFSIEPDVAIVLEGTLCYEMPKLDGHLMPTQLNKGPAISLIDRTTVYNHDLRKKIVKIAEDKDIQYQYRKTSMGGNDSGGIHTSKAGSISVTLSVPCRYIHGPLSVMSKSDYNNTFKLLVEVVNEYKRGLL